MKLRPTDLKNWAYCRRVVFYHQTMPGAGKSTGKMAAGVRAQDLLEKLELRRTLERYGWEGAERQYGIWLTCEELGLSGRVDCLLVRGDEAAVVDYKLTSGEPGANHRLQLSGYALLVERCLGKQVKQAFLYRIPDDRVFEWEVTEGWAQAAEAALVEMAEMARKEEMPAATEVRGRCTDCEYANFCGDVW